MTTEHRMTREEEALGRLLDKKETLSEAGSTVLEEAGEAAFRAKLLDNYGFQPEEYDEAMEKMRLAAAELTDHDCELLTHLWRAALAAAASIDLYDFETLVDYGVYRGDLYRYYRMLSGMIEELLWEKKVAEFLKEIAEREPVDRSDVPF
jgi:hypothetical protein